MADIENTIDTYLEAYCEPDAVRRADLIARAWTADGQLVDPPLDAQGHDAISGLTDAVLGQFPGHTFRRTSGVDAHHAFARYGWDLVAGDGSVSVSGVDFAEVDEAGRLTRVVGFFGGIPAR